MAVKVLAPGLLADESAGRRFRKEALALAKLNHPHIGSVYDFSAEGALDYLVMEHIAGVTLAEKLRAGALPEKEVVALGAQLASALEEAHEHGVVHRDLKPGNVMVTGKGQAKSRSNPSAAPIRANRNACGLMCGESSLFRIFAALKTGKLERSDGRAPLTISRHLFRRRSSDSVLHIPFRLTKKRVLRREH